MTIFQVLLFFLGLVAIVTAVCTNPFIIKILLARCVLAVLWIRVALFCLLIVAMPFHKEAWASGLLHLKIKYAGDLIYAGGFIGYQACTILFPTRSEVLRSLLFDRSNAFYTAIRFFAGTVFLRSSLGAIFFFDQSLAFFHTCGYGEAFMIFIIGLEMIGGVMLLIKRTAGYAAIVLSFDMIGAIFTHYHNYFVRDLPDPFGNSIPALITLTVLITVASPVFKRSRKSIDHWTNFSR
jgi:uncharacterized membrane protein YphA (DoxX/SURF4 family)